MKGKTVHITRRQLIGSACALAFAGVTGRTWFLNATAQAKPATIAHPMGAWVELEGAFVMDRASERTNGYAVRVTKAERLSYNQYVKRYATDGSQPIDGLDTPSLVCLSVGIRNENSNGGLGIATMYLVPARKNEFLVPDTDLLLVSETKLRESGASLVTGVSIRPGTEYEMRLAYCRQGGAFDQGDLKLREAYLETLDDTAFDLVLTNLPVRHTIRVTTE